jgi:hypothetical protein
MLAMLTAASAVHAQSPSGGRYTSGSPTIVGASTTTQQSSSQSMQSTGSIASTPSAVYSNQSSQSVITATVNPQMTASAGSMQEPVNGSIFTASNLSFGTRGSAVAELQGILLELGYLTVPPKTVLGYFGTLTRSALNKYQLSLGVPQTGMYDTSTRSALAQWLLDRRFVTEQNGTYTWGMPQSSNSGGTTSSGGSTGTSMNVAGTGYWYNGVWTPRDPMDPGFGYFSNR